MIGMMSRLRRLAALGWPGVGSSRRLYALGVVALIILLALIRVVIAQSSRRPPAGLQLAARALIEGRYDEIPGLKEKLDAQDPNVVAVRARALVARGRYQEAETALRPVAQRAPSSAAALELGLLLQMLGRADGPAILGRVAAVAAVTSDPLVLSRAARALDALGRFGEANSAYRDAVSAAPHDAAINTAWGELFLEKYNRADALKSFQAALQDDQKYGPALLGSARALADDNPPQAAAFAQKALQVNPSDVGAHVFLAGHAVDAGHRDEARKIIQKALVVNPSSPDAHALLAALAYVEDNGKEFDAEVAKVLVMAPGYGEVYRVSGDLAARNYRFDEAVALVRRALGLDPRSARSLADLGVHLLRTGDEPGARQALEASFKLDAYDVVTFNLLQMMDTLDKFLTVQDGDVVLRMHKDEAPLLQDYALSLAHRALETLSRRYGFTPKGPILIEIFPKHDDFAVRNVGLPGMIGALGACFGRVVTMDSPRARPPGEFQWEATLWHELAHVVTIQMSNQRVPRWLTEGISVYEETVAKPEWGRGMDLVFAGLMNRGETLKLKDLNAAFTNPQTISIAYFQASLLVEYFVKTFGDEGLHKLLRAYGQGLETDAALKAALSTDFDDLQGGFDQAMDRRFGALRAALKGPDDAELLRAPVEALQVLAEKNPGSYPVHLVLGNKLREAGKVDDAIKAFERAAVLAPVATGQDSPSLQIAQLSLERKDRARAIPALQAVLAADFDNVVAARQLATVMREASITDSTRTRPVYERIAAIDPFDADVHATLGRLAMQRDDTETAIREFRAVIALKPVDKAAAFTDLAESYFKGGKRAEARKQTIAALEIAPSYERAQDLLLKLSEGRP
jgi:tetratricopeptide (TPR) repeat protein